MQKVFTGNNSLENLNKELTNLSVSKLLFVHGNSFNKLPIKESIKLEVPFIEFTDFTPNPDIADAKKGLEIFNGENCNAILAIGGGSAMDVAKCIKYYSGKDIPIIAVPTTAGSGSEATQFAVIYENKVKQSIRDSKFIPDVVFLDGNCLKTLPIYQRKSALLDALCQAIESMWSVNSNDESKKYAVEAITSIVANYKAYIFEDDFESYPVIMKASFDAGRAINITQTTAAHAMAYKITTKYGFAHGHAVASSLPYIWEYMFLNMDKCIDSRGASYVEGVFDEIAKNLGQKSSNDAIKWFKDLMTELDMKLPETSERNDLDELVSSVNVTRLKNNPVEIDEEALRNLYSTIVAFK